MDQMTLWEMIDNAARQIPFSKAKVETAFSTTLVEQRRSTHTVFLEGGKVGLAQGNVIEKIDLRLGVEANDPGFMVLDIGGTCVTLAQVRSHYGTLQITGAPRGRSLDEATTHTATMAWGKLSFGFKERKPDCLASIIFDPKPGA